MSIKDICLGIDLGTTNSCVAMVIDGRAEVIPNLAGARTTSSVVCLTKDGKKIVVGQEAKRLSLTNPDYWYETKRLIGCNYSEIKDREKFTYKVIANNQKDGAAWIEASDGQKISPEEVGAHILKDLKKAAEAYLGKTVKKAVITVPAYFNDTQRTATKNAGEIAGLEVIRIINEPTAAALAYGLDKKGSGNIVVYDLGGGTFDISVLSITDGVFEVKATNGDTHLGGADFDNVLLDYVLTDFRNKNSVDLSKDKIALQRIKEAVEQAKISLSTTTATDINLPFISQTSAGPIHLNINITRAKLEMLVENLIKRTLEPCKKVMSDAGLTNKDIDEVILVGGMTRMPKIIEVVEQFFGKKPNKTVNPDEVVACGAAYQGAILTHGNVGNNTDVVLLDVTPLSLGIETLGGVCTKMIPRNTTIPTKTTQVFTTSADNQTTVTIRIFQGEREMAADNKLLGQFDLSGIESAPRGVPQVEVTYDIDANGILHVHARDKKTGKDHSITVKANGGLSQDEIEKIRKNAEQYAEEDKKKRILIESRNKAESLVYEAEKFIYEKNIADDLKNSINEKISLTRTAINGTETEEIDKCFDDLANLLDKARQSVQDQQNSSNTNQEDNQDGGNNTKN